MCPLALPVRPLLPDSFWSRGGAMDQSTVFS
jgi:hypothetical protein